MVRILNEKPQAAPEVKEEIEEETEMDSCGDPNCGICHHRGSPVNEPVILEKKPETPIAPTAAQPANPTVPIRASDDARGLAFPPKCNACGKRIEEIGVRSVIVKTLTLTKLGPGNFSESPIMETFHCNNCGKIVADSRKEALDMIAVPLPPTVGLK